MGETIPIFCHIPTMTAPGCVYFYEEAMRLWVVVRLFCGGI